MKRRPSLRTRIAPVRQHGVGEEVGRHAGRRGAHENRADVFCDRVAPALDLFQRADGDDVLSVVRPCVEAVRIALEDLHGEVEVDDRQLRNSRRKDNFWTLFV